MIRRIAGAALAGTFAAAAAVVPVASGGLAGATASAPALDELDLVLLDQRFGLEPDESWRATFAVEGDLDPLDLPAPPTSPTTTVTSETSDERTPGSRPAGNDTSTAELRVAVHVPIDDRAELAAFIVDGDERDEIDAVTAPLAPSITRAGRAARLDVDVATTTERSGPRALGLRRPGLYPVTVQVLADDDVVAEHRTLIERRPIEPSDAAPIGIAILAGLPDPAPDATDDLTDDQRADVEGLVELAGSYEGPLTVTLPPAVVSGVVAEAPALGEALRDALSDDDELISLPSVPLDPSSAVAVGQGDTFTRHLVDGEEILGAALTTVPPARSAWITPASVSDDAAELLRALGFDLLVFDEATYGQLEGSVGGYFDTTLLTDVELGDDRTMPAAVLSPLGRLLDPSRSDSVGPVDAAVRILAELVTTRRELGDDQRRGVVLAAPDGRLPDADVARALLELSGQLDDVTVAKLSTLARSTDTMQVARQPSAVVLPATAGPDLSARLERIDLTRLSAESAGSMQVDDADVVRWRAELDALVTTALTDEAADAALTRIAVEAEAVRASVEAPAPFNFTLTGRSSTLRLNLRNNADEPRRVIVRARSPKLTFPDGDELVELPPLGVTEVVIPVEARSNGTSSIDVELLTPALGQRVNGSVELTAHANALTGLGQVITVGALLVLASWWFSHHRRQRRERLVPAAGATTAVPLDQMSPDAAEVSGANGDRSTDSVPQP